MDKRNQKSGHTNKCGTFQSLFYVVLQTRKRSNFDADNATEEQEEDYEKILVEVMAEEKEN